MVRPTLKKQIPNLQEAIKEAAWKQIAEEGAPALSLRAVARELKITAPAIYNYFPRRDDLVTALIVDAFNSLADSQEAALEKIPDAPRKHALCLGALGLAYREWAVTYPQRYLLIFGTTIPAYVAPVEVTQPATVRSLSVLIGVLHRAIETGALHFDEKALDKKLLSELKAWQKLQPKNELALYLALVIWSRVHGLVMIEINKQYPPFIIETAAIFQREIENLVKQYIP
jgi:AcrR family transcriptional regulator